MAWLSRWIPAALPGRIVVQDALVVLEHPVPTAAVHLVAMPRRRLSDAHVTGLVVDEFWRALGDWLCSAGARRGIRVGITNVGSRQDVPQLHVHLIGECPEWAVPPLDVVPSDDLVSAVRTAVTDPDRRPQMRLGGSWGFAVGEAQTWRVAAEGVRG